MDSSLAQHGFPTSDEKWAPFYSELVVKGKRERGHVRKLVTKMRDKVRARV